MRTINVRKKSMRIFAEKDEKKDKKVECHWVMRSLFLQPKKGCPGAYLTAGGDHPRERYKWMIQDRGYLQRKERMDSDHEYRKRS